MRLRSFLSPRSAKLALPLALLLLATSAAARAAHWEAAGLEGGSVRCLVVAPDQPENVYAGTEAGGVFFSSDAGESWSWGGLGMGNIQVWALALAAATDGTPETLYAGTETGVWKSVDGAVTWSAASDGLFAPQVVQLAVDPARPAVLYAGTGRGLAKSVDGAVSWQPVLTPFKSVGFLALDAAHPGTVWAAPSHDRGLFRSTDGGATWSDRLAALDSPLVTALTVDGKGGVFAAVEGARDGGPALLYNSGDTGDTGADGWTAIGEGLEERSVAALALSPRSNIFYAATDDGLFRSTDLGRSWQRGGAPGRLLALALVPGPRRRETVFVGAQDFGVLKSGDSGRTFAAANSGLLAGQVLDLALSPGEPSTLYVRSVDSQIWQSPDGGATFVAATALPAISAQGLAVDPVDPSVVYVGLRGRIAKSSAKGASWDLNRDGAALQNMVTQSIAIDPQDRSLLFATGLPTEFRDLRCGAFKSTDAGNEWSCIVPLGSFVLDLAIAPSAPATVYAAATSAGVQRSGDHGETWSVISAGLGPAGVLSLAVDPANAGTVYAGSDLGVWKTTDGGATWVNASAGLPAAQGRQPVLITSLAVDPGDPQIVYAAVARYLSRTDPPRLRVYRSTDGAANWSLFSDGLPRVSNSSKLVVDSRHPGTVYLGTYGRGVYRLVP